MANIKKRSDNTYQITVSCGYDSKGRKLRKYKTVTLPETMTPRQTEKEIQKAAALFEREVETGAYLDGEKITLAEFADKWLVDYAEKQLTPATQKSYKTRLEKRIIPALGHLKLAKLQPHHLIEFYNNLSEEGIRLDSYYKPNEALIKLLEGVKCSDIDISFKTFARIKNGEKTKFEVAEKIAKYFNKKVSYLFMVEGKGYSLSGKTIKLYHDQISSILSTAVQWNIIPNNPAERVKPPKVEKRQIQFYDEIQTAELLSLLENEPLKFKAAVYIAVDTGLRVGELAGLTWGDIDFNNGRIRIDKQRQYVHGYGVITKSPKTDSGVRYVTISDMVVSLLRKYNQEQKENRLKMGELWIESDNVFVHEDGSPIHPHRPYKWFTEFLEKHGLPKITFHALRHTNASLLISRGADIVTLSGRLGHSNKNVTLNTYSHCIESKEKQAANKMNDFYSELSLNQ